jgi:hypothetical protein
MEKELERHKNPKASIGGRLRHHKEFWKRALQDNHQIADAPLNGARMLFKSSPPLRSKPANINPADPDLMANINGMLEINAIRELSQAEARSVPGFYCRVFTVPKKDSDKRRFIFNLKPLNKFVKRPNYKAELLKDALALIKPGEWLTSVDISEAFHHIPFNPSLTKYLRFAIQEDGRTRVFEYSVLPMGLSSSPGIYTKVMKVPMSYLRIEGIRIIAYVDDLLIISESKDQAMRDTQRVLQVLAEAGFTANLKKSELTPTQHIQYLGMIIDTAKMTVSVPKVKIDTCKKAIKKVLSASQSGLLTGRLLMHLIGKLNSFHEAIRETRTHLLNLKLDQHKATGDRNWDATVHLGQASLDEIHFWRKNLSILAMQGRYFLLQPPSVEINTDSSDYGFGATITKGDSLQIPKDLTQLQGRWSKVEAMKHINWKELQTIKMAIQHYGDLLDWRHITIKVRSDNIVAVAYVNRGGGRKQHLNQVMKEMSPWLKARDLTLHAEYIKGTLNVTADHLSREIPHQYCDWSLRDKTFASLNREWGPLTFDLFASDHNKRLPLFASFHPHPNATATDGLSLNWANPREAFYANPPFSLMPKVLQKIHLDKATLVVIAPVWPTALWWPSLINLCAELPLLIPVGHQYTNPFGAESEKGPSWGSAAWILSGDTQKTQSFRQRLSSSWSSLTAQDRLRTMTVLGEDFANSSAFANSRFESIVSSLTWRMRRSNSCPTDSRKAGPSRP